jgi:membrane protease YdiL (CAAX protease family)
MSRAAPAIEALLLLAVTLPLAIGFGLPTLWFVVPFALITITRRRYEDYGLTLSNLGSWRFHLAVCIIVFGGYSLGLCALACGLLGHSFHPTLPAHFGRLAVDQIVVIGLSEEFFFRGYLQTHLDRVFGRPYRFAGAQWGAGLILAALLFGLCHIVLGNWTRMQVAFFGLFVGWLRERTDSIAVPAVYHGVANLLQEFLLGSLR